MLNQLLQFIRSLFHRSPKVHQVTTPSGIVEVSEVYLQSRQLQAAAKAKQEEHLLAQQERETAARQLQDEQARRQGSTLPQGTVRHDHN